MRVEIRVGWRGVVGFAIFAAVFALLIAAGPVGDLLIRTGVWLVIVTTSALLLLQRFRWERPGLQSPDTLLKRWNRWAMDEHGRR